MTRHPTKTKTETGPPREVAVLADGPWALRRYWRSDLDAMQACSRSMGYPDTHPSAVLRGYRPTTDHAELAEHGGEATARVWRYQAPTPSTQPTDDTTAPRRRSDTRRGAATAPSVGEAAERDRLHRLWATDRHDQHDDSHVAEGSLW